MTADRNTYSREWMRIKRAKDRIPKLEKELARLKAMIEQKDD